MKPQNKAGIIYLILVIAIYGGAVFFAALIADDFDKKEAPLPEALIVLKDGSMYMITDYKIINTEYVGEAFEAFKYVAETVHCVTYVESLQTFHEYTIIGGKYVLHHANCKCKN